MTEWFVKHNCTVVLLHFIWKGKMSAGLWFALRLLKNMSLWKVFVLGAHVSKCEHRHDKVKIVIIVT